MHNTKQYSQKNITTWHQRMSKYKIYVMSFLVHFRSQDGHRRTSDLSIPETYKEILNAKFKKIKMRERGDNCFTNYTT